MSLSVDRLRSSLESINKSLKSSDLERILVKKKILSEDVDKTIQLLCEAMLSNLDNAFAVRKHLQFLLLPLVTSFLNVPEDGFTDYQVKCVVLSILAETNGQVLWHSRQYFSERKEAPFIKDSGGEQHKHKKIKFAEKVSDLQILQMCLRFLKADPCFYGRIWNWSQFIQIYSTNCTPLQKLYCNRIMKVIFGLSNQQFEALNQDIPLEICVELEAPSSDEHLEETKCYDTKSFVEWKYESGIITDIEGVYLPVYNKSVVDYYQDKLDVVKVDSTSVNLRSLALGVSSGKAVCLCGSVGSGKTTLVEYLAKRVGRLPPKSDDFRQFLKSQENFQVRQTNGNKRKLDNEVGRACDIEQQSFTSGFLRIQLGDQTDSKVLLGQYRCTDIPGEFVWQPGVLTQAVMNGDWLLLEDVDTATQDVSAILTNLLENNFLRVPGFRENLKIAHGFQLFLTLRTHKQSNHSSNLAYSLLEKHLYTINMLPLSRTELSSIICQNYPKLSTVSSRVVDVFLIFSRDQHKNEVTYEDVESDFAKIKELPHKSDEDENVLPYAKKIKLNNLINVGRTVSTRDLLKLCKRSNLTFKATSSECAYLVFQNCVDLFCSHLPAGELKTNFVICIGARLGIIETRCIYLANEYKPTVKLTSEEITIGRETISRYSSDINEKRLKFGDESSKLIQRKTVAPTFSFTRVSSCILERISVAVQQNEPILLVGETGTGKTSSVQYLAYQTNHNLVVVNMNNQSDVSDLIGGYKPVDMQFIITPVRNEFENLFAKTFDVLKNEKFLSHIASCVNRSDFSILIKLMLKVVLNAYKTLKGKENDGDLKRWQNLEQKLQRLDQQLKHSLNISFAFIPGSLVNCIKNGDWVLLDEINLASTETLECLSTILEPDGSVILLERGDYVPVKRHPNFRIFACMNPSTDVGKKDLPVGIRNRFTEFFVDELTAEKDLLILVGDYLSNTGIEKSRIHKAVQLYMDLRNLSQLELNDGLGNKPVFSLRTLCRALRTCAKNLCGSTERNLYESFCLSFLTQLDSQSHQTVLKKIQHYLVSDVKRVLSQSIPKPRGNVMNFEGFWIEMGEKEPSECKEYILTESVQNNLKDLARIISIGRLPILIQGPTSAGKTSLIEYIAKRSGNTCLRINNHEHTDLQEYVGTYVADHIGKLSFQEGVLVKAMRYGYWIILDELNLAPSDILEALNRVLDDNRELYIPETQVLVKAHPNFMLFATQNPPGIYGGRKTLSRAFKNRFIELHFSDIPKKELEVILERRCMIPMKFAQKMVKTMSALQVNRRTTTTRNNFTLRDLFRWGNRYTFADNTLLKDRNYDWNQHLVDEGYLVLSAKVRNQAEIDIIVDTLKKNFSKDVCKENLFSLNENTSKVTKGILENLMRYKGVQNVVWTFEMRRMAILVSKSMQFNEPVLLVGPTGCGKTTVCQLLSELHQKNLRILNCHMHTESADFIGGLRPCRESKESNSEQSTKLFEWADGPLIYSMQEGSYFLADEISLAEDSVLERLNCVLEPERTILLAEKGGVNEDVVKNSDHSEFVIKAFEGFQFLATMNPGGDFGKKELSPALRNRFTELWCSAMYSDEDLKKISINLMQTTWCTENDTIEKIAEVIVNTVNLLKKMVQKLNFSIRDVLAYVNYITINHDLSCKNKSNMGLTSALIFGLKTIFLDSLEMLPFENLKEIPEICVKALSELKRNIKHFLLEDADVKCIKLDADQVELNIETFKFGIKPFYLDVNHALSETPTTFTFSAPTTKQNLLRVLSAMSLKKAILLEGAPGVGKSSLIENISSTIGYNLVRINLCEHTDIADLFGTDLPVESSIFENENNDVQLGSFVWRDGPLLAALKSPNTWILLDELNLAPQSVLEGLNAILDHRGEVYITELNKTFKLGQSTRIFATQNPLRQGGNRKGLPQSFLNRFTKVYLRKLEKSDLYHVVSHNFGALNNNIVLNKYNLINRMVSFSERLENGITNLEFGFKGGPFEANLRDMLRWCDFVTNQHTGYDINSLNDAKNFSEFQLVLYEKMKLVYCQRMRTEYDVERIIHLFGEIFECNVNDLERKSKAIAVFWNDSQVFFNDIACAKKLANIPTELSRDIQSVVLSSQLTQLKSLTECTMLEKPVILCGPTDCGKTKIIDTFCEIYNENLNFDTIDDSVTGSFQQFDFNRMLEEVWKFVEDILFKKMVEIVVNKTITNKIFSKFYNLWREYDNTSLVNHNDKKFNEVENFCKRLDVVQEVIKVLSNTEIEQAQKAVFEKMAGDLTIWKNFLIKTSSTLNTGGHFVWIDSMIVKSIKFGHYICLEHVNLVSSAILDRLNPILEPNGTLMIAEKGVDESSRPETIAKHQNFRIFLTVDPKFGEISRAMRNRCIELSLSHQMYTEDDLRKLIYLQGVHETFMILAILDIHKTLNNVTEYGSFGVSHVVKMAFLVSQNKSMGLEHKKCLTISAVEVYVRSSNVDMTGFGLEFYRSKLKQQIVETVSKIVFKENVIDYSNMIIQSNEMSEWSMIKLQSEVLLVLLRCANKGLNYTETLRSLHSQITGIENEKKFTRYMLLFLYMLSTFSDVHKRKIYLNKMITAIDKSSKLILLNDKLSIIVKEFSSLNVKKDVPWNSRMFNRLRSNRGDIKKLDSRDEYRIALILILETSVKDIFVGKTSSMSAINIISYSKAVQQKVLADTANNKVLTELFGLLNSFKAFAEESLRSEKLEVDDKQFVKLATAFLWFNRVLDVSSKKLFIRNSVSVDLIDELYLHIKWLGKYCVSHLKHTVSNHKFIQIFNELENFVLGRCHSLQMYKKIYAKKFSCFMPFYHVNQIKMFEELEASRSLTTVIPHMNEPLEFSEYQVRLVLMMDPKLQKIRYKFNDMIQYQIEENFNSFEDEMKQSELYDGWVESCQNHEIFMHEDRGTVNTQIANIKCDIKKSVTDEINNIKYDIELLPIAEYFFLKILTSVTTAGGLINEEYPQQIKSIDCSTQSLVKIINDKRFDILQRTLNNQGVGKNLAKKISCFMMKVTSTIQESTHKSLLINNELCKTYADENAYMESSNKKMFINGAILTSNIMSLVAKNGEVRKTGLRDVEQWKICLSNLQKLLWLNAETNSSKYDMLKHLLRENTEKATNLLSQIEYVKNQCQSIENENFSDFNQEFWNLVKELKCILEKDSKTSAFKWMKNYLLQSLSNVVTLNLLSYFPLIDPVKKNQLKTLYVEDDIDHLNHFLLCYKTMSHVLEYENIGIENRDLIDKEVDELRIRHEKYAKQTALRPEICLYSTMVKEINHYLSSFCHPKQFLSLFKDIEDHLLFKVDNKNVAGNQQTEKRKLEIGDVINKFDTWILNSDKFLGHTLKKYNSYYRDFTAPIHFCVTALKDGLIGLKFLLTMKYDSIQVTENGVFWSCNDNDQLYEILNDLVEFPSKSFGSNKGLKKSQLFSTIEFIENGESLYFEVIKSNIQEIVNATAINGRFTTSNYKKIDHILNICNQLWQKQEETKAKRQAEEDSLYVTKTKCKEEDEEQIKMREIAEMFPENTESDFNDFIQSDTLEQTRHVNKSTKDTMDIITEDDFKLIGDFFIGMMTSEMSKNANKDFVTVFNHKMKLFGTLFDRFKNCLDGSIDVSSYNGLCLLVGLGQDLYGNNEIYGTRTNGFNFYKDGNIQEALSCMEVMAKLEKRAKVELEQWPDHAVLNDIIIIIRRIQGFSCDSSLVRFNVGMQILRKKVHEWNSVAHKLNNFKDIEHEIGEIIQKWMRIELQCWRESLNQSIRKIEAKSYRYWFFLYNLIHEFLNESPEMACESSLVNFDDVQKRFGQQEVNTEDRKSQRGKISVKAVTNVLKQFIESSSYAEFDLRMKLLKSFENYLVMLNDDNSCQRSTVLIALLHNLHAYFSQFVGKVREQIDLVRKPIEDKLRKFVKINSFNKDLSYFGTESNIKQVHRNLHKFLKEFETEIERKIHDLFIYKETELDGGFTEKSPSLSDVLNIQKFIGNEMLEKANDSSSIPNYNNIHKFIVKSRSLIETALNNVSYAKSIEDLDNLIGNELERCQSLRSLKIDENLPKGKQKSQAKSILNQKRKALNDFFKTMMEIGVNYKSGLLKDSMNPELINLEVTPFSVADLSFSNTITENAMKSVGQKIDLYFNKSIFKMKLLKNILLQPRSDMDPNFIERMKGFSVELFDFVQEEKKMLSVAVNQLIKLKQHLRDIDVVTDSKDVPSHISYAKEFKKFEVIKNCFFNASEVLEQLQILLKCAPSNDECKELKVLLSTNNVLHQKNHVYHQIVVKVNELVSDLKVKNVMLNSRESTFMRDLKEHLKYLNLLINKLIDVRELFVIDNEYSVHGKSICDLISSLNENVSKIKSIERESMETCADMTSVELDILSKMILVAIQNIYKEYKENVDNSAENSLNEIHFKEKLHTRMIKDIESLNVTKIIDKLGNIMDSIFKVTDIQTIESLSKMYPLIKQYKLLADYFIIHQINANKVSSKMLSIMLSVFLELAKNGFCIPENLLSDEEQQEKDSKTGGFGFEEGTGDKDVSEKLESEDQLDEAKKPDDYKKNDQEDKDCKEENGIDMSDNFDGKMQELAENDENSDGDNNESDNEEMDKEMGDTKEGADKLDDQIWGSDEENDSEQEEQDKKDETGKGSDEKGDQHNDLDAEGSETGDKQQEKQGLDAAAQPDDEKRKEQKKDIEKMDDQGDEEDQDQTNPYHNQLEEPPEPEDFDLNDQMNLDENEKENENDQQTNEENPFDIDKMKEQMDKTDEPEGSDQEPQENEEKSSDKMDSSDDEVDVNEKLEMADDSESEEGLNEQEQANDEESYQQPGLEDTEDTQNDSEKQNDQPQHDFNESKDNKSKEQNIQSMPNQKDQKSSADQVQIENDEFNQQQNDIDQQDTGEDKEGIGQAENKESETGHQGVSESKESKSNKNRDNHEPQQKRKKGNTDEERTLGNVDDLKKKFLKTVDKINESEMKENDTDSDHENHNDDDEFQHVRDAKKSDRTTLDNATEEQSKEVRHEPDSKEDRDDSQSNDQLMETDEKEEELQDISEEINSKKIDDKSSNKPSKSNDNTKDRLNEQNQEVVVDGDNIETFKVPRGTDTTAHCQMDIVNDTTMCDEQQSDELEVRKRVEAEMLSQKIGNPNAENMDDWQRISNQMVSNARELCEQLRLILEPTKCTRLKGDYRTGRRINMKKIIPYIASQFRKDKIWLRRTKAAQRDYKITIAVDDSKSMDHNNSKQLTLQTISLVSQALTLLESGKLSVVSFGEACNVLLKYNDQFNGPKLISSLNFDQKKTKIADLLDFARVMNQEDSASGSSLFEHLLIVLSDGRNIFSEGEKRVRNAIKMARLQRMFLIYIIIDNPDNKDSILDIKSVLPFTATEKSMRIVSYMDNFPFPYYVIVRDLNQLPVVLSEGLRQWFELVNSEQ